jgi:branched-chain amino acid transport system ATP-binding protein
MTAVLEISGVHKSLAGIHVLADFECVLEEGALFGLVGANGAGKTTVLNVVGGSARADRGLVKLAGYDVGALPAWQRAARGLGRIFQESRLWPDLTVREHFLVASRSHLPMATGTAAHHMRDGAMSAAELPKAFLDRKRVHMRLLDRRRVGLALATLKSCNVLLVDEIGAGLDADEARILYRLIEQIVRQRSSRAAMLIEHKFDLLSEFATEIGFMESGKIKTRAKCDDPERMSRLIDLIFDGRGAQGKSPRKA